jgi:hypothetical protein
LWFVCLGAAEIGDREQRREDLGCNSTIISTIIRRRQPGTVTTAKPRVRDKVPRWKTNSIAAAVAASRAEHDPASRWNIEIRNQAVQANGGLPRKLKT